MSRALHSKPRLWGINPREVKCRYLKAQAQANATIRRAEKKAANAQAAEAKAERKKDAKRKRAAGIEAEGLDR